MPDGDVILHVTDGTELSRDFRVQKCFPSYSSSPFKDMFAIPQPPSMVSSEVEIIPIGDPVRVLELILQFVYIPPTSPAVDDFTVLSEVLVGADRYDTKVALLGLRSSFAQFAQTRPLRAVDLELN